MEFRNVTNMKTIYFVLIFLLLIFSISGCTKKEEVKETNTTEQEINTIYAVSVTPSVKGSLSDYLEFGGDVCAKYTVDALPDATGKIVDVKVKVGDKVEKDQILAVIDPSRAGMIYSQSYVKAPISGTITLMNAVVGGMVSQQMTVARIGKTDQLEIQMNVPERYVSKIALKQTAELKFDAYPGEVFKAYVTELSPILDSTSRTMGVKLELKLKDNRIKSGMFARVKLITDTHKDIVIIPENAIVSRFGEQFVFITTNDGSAVHKQSVKTGIRVDDKREILEGVNPGDVVVIRGQTLLEDESAINIVNTMEMSFSLEKN